MKTRLWPRRPFLPFQDAQGRSVPYILKLTNEAWREWKDFSFAIEQDMRPGERFEYIKDWASKLPGAAARIAGNFHCAINANNQPWASKVTKETMNNALTLSAILAEHALLVFGYMGADKSLEAASKVWKWVERNRHRKFTARDCFQALKGTYKRAAELEPAFDVLLERHYMIEEEKHPKSGRPSRIFIVNPRLTEDWK